MASRLLIFARDIKLSHSVFALPFALLATFLASASLPGSPRPSAVQLALIVVCMVFARTLAMGVNRYADATFDAANPRTVGRAIPAGQLSPRWVLAAIIFCAVGCVAAAAGFIAVSNNYWPLIFSPLVLAWLASYSFMKRYTWLCHLHLGSSLALAPIAASLAIAPPFLTHAEPYLLAGMVMTWVAGFDIIYALQDVEVDRKLGLFSIPSRLGAEPALWIARGLHLISLTCLIALHHTSPSLRLFFTLGIAATAALLVLEHALVWRSKTHNIPMAFLTVNGIISLLLGAAGIFDVVRF
jgi:4-hydroxybenzoate polyprenyltransferase